MKFFIPQDLSKEQRDELYDRMKIFANRTLHSHVTNRKIYEITFGHVEETLTARVGEVLESVDEKVIVILETMNIYLICTPSRGVQRGMPVLVGKPHTLEVVDFEAEAET